MKTILSSRIHHYLAIVSIFLITVALIAGMVGCGGTSAQYSLSVSSTSGGNVTHPGIGTFTYPAGAVVLLEAEPANGYSFVNWSGNVSTIVDVNSPTTTITMNGHYFITANFAYGKLIQTWYDLDAIKDNLDDNYTLMGSLDSTTPGYEELASPTANQGQGWQPIGTYNATFTGAFDGQGYEIKDMFINRPEEWGIGLFGFVGEGGVVKYIGVVNATVTGRGRVGGLVGDNDQGTVTDSYTTGSVTGGVVGNGTAGGLVGFNWWGTVSNSYSTATVTGSSGAGGLVGLNDGTVSDSYATGNVTGEWEVGGLVGYNYAGTMSNSFWDTETSGQSTSAGGTGKNTTEMQDIATFTDTETEGLDEPWDIITVGGPGTRNLLYIWNIVDDETYPFLSWQPVS